MTFFKKYLPFIFLLFIILTVFHSWFQNILIVGGDFGYVFSDHFLNIVLFPFAWATEQRNGMGGSMITFLPLYLDFDILIGFGTHMLHIPWVILERILYLFPFLIMSFVSMRTLYRSIFREDWGEYVSVGIFTLNTYILMVISGGQVLIALAYSLSPIILSRYIQLSEKNNLKSPVITGVIIALQLLLDIRITYITLIGVGLYLFYSIAISKKQTWFSLVISSLVVSLLHTFWLLPTLLIHQDAFAQLGSITPTIDAVNYFSFAKFENTLSLLHPNWPENIFGKVYFMKPEFILLPILAFMSFFFIKKEKQSKHILYFALLGICGAFLAKGSQDPFGTVYLWMFQHIPGFFLFRDSTKWYMLVAVSYAVLIPFSIRSVYMFLKNKKEFSIFYFHFPNKIKVFNLQNTFLVTVLCGLLFLIKPVLSGYATGTLIPSALPQEYVHLEKFLLSQKDFSRTLWMPTTQRFRFYDDNHPAIPADQLFAFDNKADIISQMSTSETLVQDMSVKYIIIPYDSQGEIFLNNRTYDNQLYLQAIDRMQSVSFVNEVSGFGRIKVFEIKNYKDHIWTPTQSLNIQYAAQSPIAYTVTITNATKGDVIVLSESYDPGWVMKYKEKTVVSQEFEHRFNSFILPQSGSYSVYLYYQPQDLVNIGLIISSMSFAVIVYGVLFYKNKK